MPIPKYDGTPEKEWISKCMSSISGEYEQEQALAICYKQMEMSAEEMAIEDTSKLPEPKENESRDAYVMRCIPTIYKAGGEYDQRTATAMCADRYENSNTLLNKQNMSRSRFSINLEDAQAKIAAAKLREEGINLADYPWDECIADMTDRYESEETAKKVCGWIKANYGS